MRDPIISVCVPVHNASAWLAETIASIQGQSIEDWELIAIDDGSTDDSFEILMTLANVEPRMRISTRENRGIVETRNELLARARGKYISWHDADDTMPGNRLELQLAQFETDSRLVWVGGACLLTDPTGMPIRTHSFPGDHETLCKIMQEEEVACYFGSTLMRHDAIKQAGGFRQPFNICEDYDLCIRLSEIGRVTNVPEVVLIYRQHLTSTVNRGRALSYIYSRLVRELARERREHGTDRLQRGEKVELSFENLPNKAQTRLDTHRRWGWWALNDGHVRTARKYAIRALWEAPAEPASWRLAACALRGH